MFSAKRKVRLASKKVGPDAISTLDAGEDTERKTTALAKMTSPAQTAYAIFLHCRTRSTRRRRIVRGMRDSRSRGECEFYALDGAEANQSRWSRFPARARSTIRSATSMADTS
jgi:hypothetical protein